MSEQPLNAKMTYVYRFYDEADELLYVGITHDVQTRFKEHAKKGWFKNAVRSTAAPYRTRSAAFAAEATAILTEFPKHNTAIPTLARHDLLHERANQDPANAMTLTERVRAAEGVQQKLIEAHQENERLRRQIADLEKNMAGVRARAAAGAEEALETRSHLVKVTAAARAGSEAVSILTGQVEAERNALARVNAELAESKRQRASLEAANQFLKAQAAESRVRSWPFKSRKQGVAA